MFSGGIEREQSHETFINKTYLHVYLKVAALIYWANSKIFLSRKQHNTKALPWSEPLSNSSG